MNVIIIKTDDTQENIVIPFNGKIFIDNINNDISNYTIKEVKDIVIDPFDIDFITINIYNNTIDNSISSSIIFISGNMRTVAKINKLDSIFDIIKSLFETVTLDMETIIYVNGKDSIKDDVHVNNK